MEATLEDKLGRLQERLQTDEELRGQVLADPKTTFEQELGVAFPEGVDNSTIRAQWPKFFEIQEAATSGELSDAELAGVSGGWCACVGGKNGAPNLCACTCYWDL